jgi:hypothetical protein
MAYDNDGHDHEDCADCREHLMRDRLKWAVHDEIARYHARGSFRVLRPLFSPTRFHEDPKNIRRCRSHCTGLRPFA